MVLVWKLSVCAYFLKKSCPKSSLWLLFVSTKIFKIALKVPMATFPLTTPSILLSVEFIPITLLCSVGSICRSIWVLNNSSLPMRVILDPVSINIRTVTPLRDPFKE